MLSTGIPNNSNNSALRCHHITCISPTTAHVFAHPYPSCRPIPHFRQRRVIRNTPAAPRKTRAQALPQVGVCSRNSPVIVEHQSLIPSVQHHMTRDARGAVSTVHHDAGLCGDGEPRCRIRDIVRHNATLRDGVLFCVSVRALYRTWQDEACVTDVQQQTTTGKRAAMLLLPIRWRVRACVCLSACVFQGDYACDEHSIRSLHHLTL